MKKYSIGVDLGGTKILCALIEKNSSKVLFEVKKKTKKEKGNERIVSKFFEATDELFEVSNVKKSEISSIGIATAGQIDRLNGILVNSCNLECNDLHLVDIVEKRYKIKTYIANDVEAGGLGELYFGSAKGYKNVVCIFIGTGIGSCIIIDGKIYHGATGTAGEIGHMTVDCNGRTCGCGNAGCLEAYASRSAIEKRIYGAINNGKKSVITDLISENQTVSTKHIKQALDAHDEIVSKYVEEAIEYLSSGIAGIMNFLNPELIILGGGLIQGVDEIYLKTVKSAKNKALCVPAQNTEFKKAELGDLSGVIGASILENHYDV